MNILYVYNGYPTDKNPEYCVFTKEQIEQVVKTGKICYDSVFVNAREKGRLEYLRKIPELIRKSRNCDFIHCFHGLMLIVAYFIAPHKKILISFLNNLMYEYGTGKQAMVLRKITQTILRSDRVFVIYKDGKSLQKDNSFYLPNGVDLDIFKPMSKELCKRLIGLDVNTRYILFVSSKNVNRKQKRYDLFKSVLKILKEEYHVDDLEELVLVNRPREEIPYYYNAAELHLMTSEYEGSPNSVKEALACNLSVVSTNVGNVLEMIGDIEGCTVVNTFAAEDIALAVYNILDHKTENDFRCVLNSKRLDSSSKADDLKKIYDKIMGG